MTPGAESCRYSTGGFRIFSANAPEIDESYNLIKGDALTVVNSKGKVIHEGIRGFMPLNESCHFIRKADKSWWFCASDGTPKQKSSLCKKNVVLGALVFMFDERGKLRLGQQSVRFQMLSF